MGTFFKLAEEFEDYPLLNDYIEIRHNKGNRAVARLKLTSPNLQGLKTGIDALNYEIYKAVDKLGRKVNDDHILESYVAHTFPGRQINTLYKDLYKVNCEKAIAQRKFKDEPCERDSDPYEKLRNLMTTLSFDVTKYTQQGRLLPHPHKIRLPKSDDPNQSEVSLISHRIQP